MERIGRCMGDAGVRRVFIFCESGCFDVVERVDFALVGRLVRGQVALGKLPVIELEQVFVGRAVEHKAMYGLHGDFFGG